MRREGSTAALICAEAFEMLCGGENTRQKLVGREIFGTQHRQLQLNESEKIIREIISTKAESLV
jgi:hypothetical protein